MSAEERRAWSPDRLDPLEGSEEPDPETQSEQGLPFEMAQRKALEDARDALQGELDSAKILYESKLESMQAELDQARKALVNAKQRWTDDYRQAREREKELREVLHGIATKYGEESNLRAWVPAKVALEALAAQPESSPQENIAGIDTPWTAEDEKALNDAFSPQEKP